MDIRARVGLVFLSLLLSTLILIPNSTKAAPLIEVQFVALSGATLEQLASGVPGSGLLLYYPSTGTPETPGLVVLLEKATDADVSTAKIYDDRSGNGYVDIDLQGDVLNLLEPHGPTIIMTALGGWWVRNGIPNYDLDIQIFEPICAMWGAGPLCGGTGYIDRLEPGALSFEIRTRDPERLGIPQWDLRSLVPSLPGMGVIRTNYAERKCANPVDPIPSVSPGWPYVALTGGFEQPRGKFHPPIVVDWDESRITIFSELVTVRNQNCSYNLYSITPLKLGELNSPNFEAPFAFYDLSNEGRGYPNLIIRTAHFNAYDFWFAPELFALAGRRPFGHPVTNIRYSWKEDVGDGTFDYKIGMTGFHPYRDRTPIAGGIAWIDAPSYSELPSWVIGKRWQVTTFIDTNEGSYGTSEGIYEWEANVGFPYLVGISDNPDLSEFETIPQGFRGEFRYQHADQPYLYFSPLDNRLHLLYAEGGMWNLGEGWVLREHNLTGGPYIDAWTLERVPAAREAERRNISAYIAQALYAFEDHILFSDATSDSVILKETQHTPELFRLLPPIDRASWDDFRARLRPYHGQGRDPKNLRTWLSVLGGRSLEIAGGHVWGVRPEGTGIRFVLELQPGFHVAGSGGPDITNLRPGAYVITYKGDFDVQPLTPAQPEIVPRTLHLSSIRPAELEPTQVEATLRNAGLEDLDGLPVRAYIAGPDSPPQPIGVVTVTLLAGQSVPVRFDWIPPAAGEWQIALAWGKDEGQGQSSPSPLSANNFLNVQVAAQPPLDVATALRLSNMGQPLLLVAFLASLSLVAAGLVLMTIRGARSGQ